MIISVSRLSGICGIRKIGRVEGSSPMSPTVRTSKPNQIDAAVRTRMQTSGEGMDLVISGKR